MTVHWQVDADAWIEQMQAIAEEMALRTGKLVDRGQSLVRVAAQDRLSRNSHERGTPTPAPPGGPPAMISGSLARSVKAKPVRQVGPGRFVGLVGPTIVYGPIQERGGTIVAHGQFLRWYDAEGRAFFKHSVTLPARPYMWYAAEDVRDEFRETCIRSWNRGLHPRI